MLCFFDTSKGIVGFGVHPEQVMATMAGATTKEGRKDLLDGLKILHSRKPVQAVYTCPPLSFLISSGVNPDSTSNFTIVDTHCVPADVGGNGNAAVVQLNYLSVEKATCHLGSWIEKRLAASGVGNGPQCLEILPVTVNSGKGQTTARMDDLTDTLLISLDDEDENNDLCLALDNSINDIGSSSSTIRESDKIIADVD